MGCRICASENLKKFLSLGNTPLANSFLEKEELDKKEKTFPLELCFCDECKLVQLSFVVPPELMFKNYVYVSSTTKTFHKHFFQMAEYISKKFKLDNKSLVVDMGSNDGLLLKAFKKMEMQVMGVEPAANIAKIAERDGIETINDFFNENAVNQIIERKGYANMITANNVFAHINDIREVIKNVKILLKDSGIFVIEVQYLVDTIEKMTFDNIYHEHLSYFTLTSLINFFKRHEMEIFDVQRVDTHGGSLRVFVKIVGSNFAVEKAVNGLLEHEKKLGVENLELYKSFADKVYRTKETLISHIREIKSRKKSIFGYGAPAKGNTLLNFCLIGTDCIDCIIEDNPLKIGLFTPGMHIPVASSKILDEKRPDYILILAWNFAEEILIKTKKYANQGVKFIIPLPTLRIV
jgi:SAM-dependent methyltransferase